MMMFSMVRQVWWYPQDHSAHLVAKANIGGGQDEEPDREANENEIVHGTHHTDTHLTRLIK
jgi:hypothetical protein